MDKITPRRPDPNNDCGKLDPETHDRINSVWSFLLFHATCSLALDPYFLGTELGIRKLGLGSKVRVSSRPKILNENLVKVGKVSHDAIKIKKFPLLGQ